MLVRVGGRTYDALGACAVQPPIRPGPTTSYENYDIAPGTCIATFDSTLDECNKACYGNLQCPAFVYRFNKTCFLKNTTTPRTDAQGHVSYVLTGPHPNPTDCFPALIPLQQLSATHTRTVFNLTTPDRRVQLDLLFQSAMFSDSPLHLSRPVYPIHVNVRSLDRQSHTV